MDETRRAPRFPFPRESFARAHGPARWSPRAAHHRPPTQPPRTPRNDQPARGDRWAERPCAGASVAPVALTGMATSTFAFGGMPRTEAAHVRSCVLAIAAGVTCLMAAHQSGAVDPLRGRP